MELKGKRRKSCRQAGSRRTRTASSSASGAPVRSSTAASATADMRAEPSGGDSRPYGVSCAAVIRWCYSPLATANMRAEPSSGASRPYGVSCSAGKKEKGVYQPLSQRRFHA